MAKILYFLKMFMFGIQMKYPEPMMQLLKRISTFIALIYVVPWLTCTNAANAFANDRALLQKLNQYSAIDQGVTDVPLSVLNRHLWYWTPELAPLALFSSLLSNHETQEVAEKLLQLDPKLSKEKPTVPLIDSSKNLKLSSFLNEESWLLFSFFKSCVVLGWPQVPICGLVMMSITRCWASCTR